jgi:hypothetical protein
MCESESNYERREKIIANINWQALGRERKEIKSGR